MNAVVFLGPTLPRAEAEACYRQPTFRRPGRATSIGRYARYGR
jgi:hypothetical protein